MKSHLRALGALTLLAAPAAAHDRGEDRHGGEDRSGRSDHSSRGQAEEGRSGSNRESERDADVRPDEPSGDSGRGRGRGEGRGRGRSHDETREN